MPLCSGAFYRAPKTFLLQTNSQGLLACPPSVPLLHVLGSPLAAWCSPARLCLSLAPGSLDFRPCVLLPHHGIACRHRRLHVLSSSAHPQHPFLPSLPLSVPLTPSPPLLRPGVWSHSGASLSSIASGSSSARPPPLSQTPPPSPLPQPLFNKRSVHSAHQPRGCFCAPGVSQPPVCWFMVS